MYETLRLGSQRVGSPCSVVSLVKAVTTLRASLSGTFLQTLPDHVSYATEGALFISAQLSSDAVSAPPKGSGTNMTVELSNLAPKHARQTWDASSPGKKGTSDVGVNQCLEFEQ